MHTFLHNGSFCHVHPAPFARLKILSNAALTLRLSKQRKTRQTLRHQKLPHTCRPAAESNIDAQTEGALWYPSSSRMWFCIEVNDEVDRCRALVQDQTEEQKKCKKKGGSPARNLTKRYWHKKFSCCIAIVRMQSPGTYIDSFNAGQVARFATKAATTFAPRASGASKNPAYKGAFLAA